MSDVPDLMIGLGERTLGRRATDGDTAMAFGGDVAALLALRAYRFVDEYDLQAGVREVLESAGYHVRPEHRLGRGERVDFVVGADGHLVAVECKIAGQPAATARQVARYAAHPDVAEVVLVTSRRQHRSVPREAHGKAVYVVLIGGVA